MPDGDVVAVCSWSITKAATRPAGNRATLSPLNPQPRHTGSESLRTSPRLDSIGQSASTQGPGPDTAEPQQPPARSLPTPRRPPAVTSGSTPPVLYRVAPS